jgi:hypothetical protein
MSEPEGARDGSGSEPSDEASPADEAALIREVVRMQERHREGGIDPDDDEDDHRPDTEG